MHAEMPRKGIGSQMADILSYTVHVFLIDDLLSPPLSVDVREILQLSLIIVKMLRWVGNAGLYESEKS